MDQRKRLADRSIQYAGQTAGIAVDGILDMAKIPPWATHVSITMPDAGTSPAFPNADKRLYTRIADWLDLNDYGYGLGLLFAIAGGVAAIFEVWWAAAPLVVAAFALCWWFG